MKTDKITPVLVTALRHALANPAEVRLYRAGKLDGLFPSRAGVNGDAAAQALRLGLLDIVRTESKGKTVIEWVRATPQAVAFLRDHDSPRAIFDELRAAIHATRTTVPVWAEAVHAELRSLSEKVTVEASRLLHQLEALDSRLEDAIRRADAASPVPDGVAASTPWAEAALTYLDRRKAGGAAVPCPLPELFAALRDRFAALSLPAFHEGLRRLHDTHALRLTPFDGPAGLLPEPEYALPDGATVLYYASR